MARKELFGKEKIIEKAFQLFKDEGMEEITARKLAAYMKSSPAPIYHSFDSMEELKKILLDKAKELFLEYIQEDRTGLIFLNIGLGFCTFAREERNLFKNIFLSPNKGKSIFEHFTQLSKEEIEKDSRFKKLNASVKDNLFFDCWTYVQGLASLICMKQITVDDEEIKKILMRAPAYLIYKRLEESQK